MCGIGAFQIAEGECDPAMVARVLLRLLEVRGKDASGVAWHDNNGETFVRKGAVAGKELARVLDKTIGNTGIVHTRWATQGSPSNNNNNHPIDVGGIVGVHNGHISNDNALLAKCVDYKRQAQVDSEAVFAYMAHGKKETALVDRLAEVRGNAALLWLRSYDKQQRLYAVRLTSSPLWFGQTAKGSIVFASTEAILKETAKRCKLVFEYTYEMKQGEHVMAQDCNIKHMTQVKVPAPVYVPAHNYNKPSAFALPKQQREIAQAQLDALFDDDDLPLFASADDEFDYEAEEAEYNLRNSLDKQFRMGRYSDRW